MSVQGIQGTAIQESEQPQLGHCKSDNMQYIRTVGMPVLWKYQTKRRIHQILSNHKVFTEVTMKNVVFWDMKTHFILHRRHITSQLQSSAG
jgi:type IV secretory pathway VirB6-like protein